MSQRTIKAIADLVKTGYRAKVPGGNGRMNTYAAFCAMVRYDHLAERWQILLIPYRNRGVEEERKKEDKFLEVPRQAVYREIMEETNVILLNYRSLSIHQVDDTRPEYQGKKFDRHLYVSRSFDASNIRTKHSHSQTTIGIPFWADLDEDLLKYIAAEHVVFIDDILRRVEHFTVPEVRKYFIGRKSNPQALAS